MRGEGYKSLLGRFQLDTRGKFFSLRAISHWNNISQGSGGFLTLHIFVILLDKVLGHLVRIMLFPGNIGQDDP